MFIDYIDSGVDALANFLREQNPSRKALIKQSCSKLAETMKSSVETVIDRWEQYLLLNIFVVPEIPLAGVSVETTHFSGHADGIDSSVHEKTMRQLQEARRRVANAQARSAHLRGQLADLQAARRFLNSCGALLRLGDSDQDLAKAAAALARIQNVLHSSKDALVQMVRVHGKDPGAPYEAAYRQRRAELATDNTAHAALFQ